MMMRILSPLNLLQINPLLNHLPKRTHLSQSLHMFLQQIQNEIDLLLGRKPTNPKPQTTVRKLIVHTERAEYITGLETGTGTSGAGTNGNVLECHEQTLPLDVGEGIVEASGVPMLGIAILNDLGYFGSYAVFELVREVVYPLSIEGHFGLCELAGGTHTDAEEVG